MSIMDSHADVTGKQVTVLELSLKPGTNDIRNSHSHPQA